MVRYAYAYPMWNQLIVMIKTQPWKIRLDKCRWLIQKGKSISGILSMSDLKRADDHHLAYIIESLMNLAHQSAREVKWHVHPEQTNIE